MRLLKKYRHASLLLAGALPLAALAGGGPVNRTVAADANGAVVISNVSGTVDVRGWDRKEVQVSGHLGDDVERLDVDSAGGHTVVKVVLPRGGHHDSEAVIEVKVPKGSSVEVGAVSADISSRGVLGTQRLKSVSGEITADIAGDDSEVRSVSGDVTVRGSGKPLSLRLSSVSGSLDLMNAAGKLDVVTVSGDARVHMNDATEVRGRTTSGDLELNAKLTRDGRVDVEGVSGEITLRVSGPGGLSTEIESFSGDINGCLAEDKVERVNKYGPGTRLYLRGVEAGGARVRAKTLSGDIDICDR
jgi:DUF4097 and DUF4098 domain-containing protein YvlB